MRVAVVPVSTSSRQKTNSSVPSEEPPCLRFLHKHEKTLLVVALGMEVIGAEAIVRRAVHLNPCLRFARAVDPGLQQRRLI